MIYSYDIYKKLLIIPDLNEVRGLVDLEMFQKENMSARPKQFDKDSFSKDIIFNRNLKSSNKNFIYNNNNNINNNFCSFNNCLEYWPHNDSIPYWPFKNDKSRNVDSSELWNLLYKFIEEFSCKDKINNIFIVSHHHKIREKIFQVNDNIGFANCCCIKLSNFNNNDLDINNYSNINYEWDGSIFFEGFPDKDKYNYLKNGFKINNFANNWNVIYNILSNLNNKCINLFIIRHGNSMHNNPINTKMLDSTLTPFGIWQGIILGKYINKYIINNYSKFKINFVLGSSYLLRAQHTILEIINNIIDLNRYNRLSYLKKFNDFFSIFRLISSKKVNLIGNNVEDLWNYYKENDYHYIRKWIKSKNPFTINWGKDKDFIYYLLFLYRKFWNNIIDDFINQDDIYLKYIDILKYIFPNSNINYYYLISSFDEFTLYNLNNFLNLVKLDSIPNYIHFY